MLTVEKYLQESEKRNLIEALTGDAKTAAEKIEPELVEEIVEETDPELERKIERLDRFFDMANDFFDKAEDVADRIGDGIMSLFDLDDETDEPENPEPKRRFKLVSGGIDPDLCDKYIDGLEEKIYQLDKAYTSLKNNGLAIDPYKFDDEKDEYHTFSEFPTSEDGYDHDEVKSYTERLKNAAVERWTEE